MDQFNTIFNKHCRFRLKSGKEVFGILWKVNSNGESNYYFTAASLKSRVESSHNRFELLQNTGTLIDLSDIILAEKLAS